MGRMFHKFHLSVVIDSSLEERRGFIQKKKLRLKVKVAL